MLRFYRCACLTASELDKLEAEHDARSDPGKQQQPGTDRAASEGVGGGGRSADGRGGGEDDRGGGRRGGGGGEGGEVEEKRVGGSREIEGRERGCAPPTLGRTDGDECSSTSCGTVPVTFCSLSPPTAIDESGSRIGRDRTTEGALAPERGGEGGAGATMDARVGFPGKASSAENELAALTEVVMQLLEARDAFPTTLEHDEA